MKKRVSRIILYTLLLAICASLLVIPTSASAAEDVRTAIGTADGLNGEVKVEVTVHGTEILQVEVLSHNETAGVADAAIKDLPRDIVAYQTVGLDAISGCTFASKAVLEATKSALLSLGFDEEEITKAVDKSSGSTETITKETEVVVIGAGGAGMSAAYSAKANGAEVIVIDKMSYIGGNTMAAGSSLNAADPERQQQETMLESEMATIKSLLELEPVNDLMAGWQEAVRKDIEEYEASGSSYLYDSPALHALQTYVGGDYVADPELVDRLAKEAPESLVYLEELGTEWNSLFAGMGATWRRTHGIAQNWGSNGAGFVMPQATAYEEMGGETLLGYRATELVMEDGRVTGVRGETTEGQPFEIRASKGVVIATGGFGQNVELRERVNTHWPSLGDNIRSTNVASATGDGIIMGEAIGAQLTGMEWIQLAPAVAKMDTGLSAAINNIIYINNEGKRYVREDGRRDDMSAAALAQPDAEYYWLSDMHLYEEIGGLTAYGRQVDDVVDGVNLIKSDTLEGIAEAIGCDPETLKQTVETYNSYVENSEDPEFGRAVFGDKLDYPPYYALKGEVRVHHTMGGLKINTDAQVLDVNDQPIPGLFAAGEVTGGIHGSNRLGGNAIADAISFGRIAGENVSR